MKIETSLFRLNLSINVRGPEHGIYNLVFPNSYLLLLHKEDTKRCSDDGFEDVIESKATESEHDNGTQEIEDTERLL